LKEGERRRREERKCLKEIEDKERVIKGCKKEKEREKEIRG
jgi:hypothetical protein